MLATGYRTVATLFEANEGVSKNVKCPILFEGEAAEGVSV